MKAHLLIYSEAVPSPYGGHYPPHQMADQEVRFDAPENPLGYIRLQSGALMPPMPELRDVTLPRVVQVRVVEVESDGEMAADTILPAKEGRVCFGFDLVGDSLLDLLDQDTIKVALFEGAKPQYALFGIPVIVDPAAKYGMIVGITD